MVKDEAISPRDIISSNFNSVYIAWSGNVKNIAHSENGYSRDIISILLKMTDHQINQKAARPKK